MVKPKRSARPQARNQPTAASTSSSTGLALLRKRLDALARNLDLLRRALDLFPGGVVDRDAVAAARRAHLALRLAREAHAVEPRRGASLAQPVEEQARLALERLGGAELVGVDEDGEHAVQDALLLALFVVPRASARERAAEQ